MDKELYNSYVNILREELVPAMGCTEPIAVAYAAALARKTLGCLPEKVDIRVSANIIKNVKSVVVPHTGGLRGIAAAASAGNYNRQFGYSQRKCKKFQFIELNNHCTFLVSARKVPKEAD